MLDGSKTTGQWLTLSTYEAVAHHVGTREIYPEKRRERSRSYRDVVAMGSRSRSVRIHVSRVSGRNRGWRGPPRRHTRRSFRISSNPHVEHAEFDAISATKLLRDQYVILVQHVETGCLRTPSMFGIARNPRVYLGGTSCNFFRGHTRVTQYRRL